MTDISDNLEKDIGYKSNDSCVVCGGFDRNQLEPRFLYTVCSKHYHVPPASIHKYTYEETK